MLIHVRSALEPGRVALFERHSDHPDGEIFIADDKVHTVANTTAVLEAVARNALVVVPEPSKPVAETPRKGKS